MCQGSFAFLIVDLTFHGHWHIRQVLLGSHSSLATRKDATVEVVLATCHKCSSKLCSHLGPHLYSKRQLCKNHNFGTATRVEIMQSEKCEAAKL